MGTNYEEGTGTLDFQLLKDKIDQLEVMAGGPASGVSFANSGTDLTSENVQDAIAEIKGLLDAIVIPDPQDASEVEFTPGDTGLSATDVQAVIEEIKGLLDNLEGEIAGTLSAAEITFDDQNTEITAENVQAAVEALDTAIGDLEQPITIGNQFRIPLVNSGETDFTYSDDLQFDGDRLSTNDLRLTDQAAPSEETYKLVIDDQGDITSVEDVIPSLPDPLEVVNLDVTTTADLLGVTVADIAAPSSTPYMVTVDESGVLSSSPVPETGLTVVPDPLEVDEVITEELTVSSYTELNGLAIPDLAADNGNTNILTIEDDGSVSSEEISRVVVETGSYEPTLTNASEGTGGSAENTATYLYIGGPETGDIGLLHLTGVFVLGSSDGSVSGSISFSLPPGFNHYDTVTNHTFGFALMNDSDGALHVGNLRRLTDSGAVALGRWENDSNNIIHRGLSASTPFTWAPGDYARWSGVFRVIKVA